MTTSSVPNTPWRALTLAVAIAAAALPATAQNTPGLRDPMVPPLAIARPATSPGSLEVAPEPPPTPRQLLTVDGRRYVVDGRRRLGVGDALGGTRIERITDSAVWVREGDTVTRLPFYGGVVKHNVSSLPASAPAAGSRPKKPVPPFHPSTRSESP
jgi:hypothetical protein